MGTAPLVEVAATGEVAEREALSGSGHTSSSSEKILSEPSGALGAGERPGVMAVLEARGAPRAAQAPSPAPREPSVHPAPTEEMEAREGVA